MNKSKLPVAVIGAGPVGLAAAAHLADRNIPFIIFEAGNSVGHNMADWSHVRVFSPWRYNIDKAALKLLSQTDWVKPDDDDLPTGSEIIQHYLLPLSLHPKIKPFLHVSSKIVSITRRGLDKMKSENRDQTPFIVRSYENGNIRSFEVSAVIDASGTWKNPNPIGAGGVFAVGELENADRIAYRIPDILGKDKYRYAGKNVVVVGGGHSAINSLLELASLKAEFPKTKLNWILRTRNMSSVYGGKEKDALEARGSLGTRIENLVQNKELDILSPYYINEIIRPNGKLTIRGYRGSESFDLPNVDEIIANTGSRPDTSFLKEVRVQFDPSIECVPDLADLIDPNIHSCGTVRPHGEFELKQPEPNFYIVGVKSYGRAPTFLMATGYEQVRSITAWLDGDFEAARRVELDLPETGVCSTNTEAGSACCSPATITNKKEETMETQTIEQSKTEKIPVVTGCCGGAPTSNADACCKLDEEKKAEGESGCGCNTATVAPAAKVKSSCC